LHNFNLIITISFRTWQWFGWWIKKLVFKIPVTLFFH
jgi:hypothetical protein